jgi:hypothetical protein
MLTLPSLHIKWGSYSKPDPTEEKSIVDMVRIALGGSGGGEPIITKRVAVETIRPFFNIENVDALLDELEEEAQARQDKALEQTTAEASALHKLANGDAPTGQRGGPPKGPGAGSGATGAPAPKAPSGKNLK